MPEEGLIPMLVVVFMGPPVAGYLTAWYVTTGDWRIPAAALCIATGLLLNDNV